jgi:hypothetical protein
VYFTLALNLVWKEEEGLGLEASMDAWRDGYGKAHF